MTALAIWILAAFASKAQLFAEIGGALLALELLIPASRVSWASRFKGALFSLVYFFAGAAATMTVYWFSPAPLFVLHGSQGWWIVAGAILLSDLWGYWEHRAMHAVPWLWRIHRTHHSITEMSAAASYKHWAEEICMAAMIYIPTAFLYRLRVEQWGLLLMYPVVNNLYQHSPIRLHFGRFAAVLMDNRFHRLHHSVDPAHRDKNFGAILTVWDWLFGTLAWPKPREWPEVGIAGRRQPESLGAYLIDPLAAD